MRQLHMEWHAACDQGKSPFKAQLHLLALFLITEQCMCEKRVVGMLRRHVRVVLVLVPHVVVVLTVTIIFWDLADGPGGE